MAPRHASFYFPWRSQSAFRTRRRSPDAPPIISSLSRNYVAVKIPECTELGGYFAFFTDAGAFARTAIIRSITA